jgi:hypothetical protein
MEKQESKKRFPTFPQPRRLRIHNRLRDTHSEGKVILASMPFIGGKHQIASDGTLDIGHFPSGANHLAASFGTTKS